MPKANQSDSITRKSGSNLAIAFAWLDRGRRRAMSVFYAFCRVVDDIADDAVLPREEKVARLEAWRRDINLCYTGEPRQPLARELAPVLRDYLIPPALMQEIIDGVAMDLDNVRYATWEGLRQYCYRVASCVGLVSIEIFGYRNPGTRRYAELLGLAFQTTNILRDVRTDLAQGRIYIPDEDFERAGWSAAELERGIIDHRALRTFKLMAARSEHFYAAAERALPPEDRPAMIAAQAMRRVYYGVLRKIRRHGCDTWNHSGRLGKFAKLRLLWQSDPPAHRRPALRRAHDIAVLGAGCAGLAAAFALARAGHRVTLVEARQTAGGRTHSFPDPETGDILDNGQHILMGCYKETLSLLDEAGATPDLHPSPRANIAYLNGAGGLSRLRAGPFPAPFHLLGALLRFEELGPAARLNACRGGGAAHFARPGEWRGRTVADWFAAARQSSAAIRALWEPFCLAALNEPPATASAELFLETVRRALLDSPSASAVLFSRVGLSRLLVDPVVHLLQAAGGRLVTGRAVRSLEFRGPDATAAVFDDGSRVEADAFVSALPWRALASILPAGDGLAERARAIPGAPIVGIHLWLDRPVLDEPFAGLLDSPIHWIFNRPVLNDREPSSGPSVALVISGAYGHVDTPSARLAEMAMAELRRFLPAAREARALRHFVYKARDATLQARPATLPLRPTPVTDWPNFVLAGDWTDTGLPSTIEGAVLSGRRAAAILS